MKSVAHLLLVPLLAAVACSDPLRPDPVPPELAPAPPPHFFCMLAAAGGECPTSNCTSNARTLVGFFLGALRLSGCPNLDDVRLLQPTLVSKDPRCPRGGLTLDVVDGRLVGRRASARCSGAALDGATFWIHGPASEFVDLDASGLSRFDFLRVELRIKLAPSAARLDDAAAPPVPAYGFERTGQIQIRRLGFPPTWDALPVPPASWYGGETALCTHAMRWTTPWDAAAAEPSPPVDQHAVIVTGEAYFESDDELDARTADDWMHVACAGSALAKARLQGLRPGTSAWPRWRNLAMLKMLTGRYCDRSQTADGTLLYVEEGSSALLVRPERRVGPIEARWAWYGATCLSHARVWTLDGPPPASDVDGTTSEPAFLASIRARCPWLQACTTSTNPAVESWTTYAVDHARHPPTVPPPVPATSSEP